MSADPYIQAPSDLQSFNRYAYVRNNPLNKTDPTGYSWWTKLRDKFIKPAIARFLDIYCGGCATILLNAYNASQVRDANGHRLGWKGAFFSVGISLLGGASDNSIYQSGVNALSGCGMSAMAGGSCKKGAVEAVTNDIAGPVIGGCINASRAGQSCAVGAREGATSALGGWAAGQVADGAHNYLNSRGGGGSGGSANTSMPNGSNASPALEYVNAGSKTNNQDNLNFDDGASLLLTTNSNIQDVGWKETVDSMKSTLDFQKEFNEAATRGAADKQRENNELATIQARIDKNPDTLQSQKLAQGFKIVGQIGAGPVQNAGEAVFFSITNPKDWTAKTLGYSYGRYKCECKGVASE